MEILKFAGMDRELFSFIVPLVMDSEVIRQNNNYPFKTSEEYVWFVAVNDRQTVGFMPVCLKDKKAVINNYFVQDDDPKVLKQMISSVIEQTKNRPNIEAVSHMRHINSFEQTGFSIQVYWKKYAKMTHCCK